jgi:acyl homoserine lactone synthase
MLRYIYGRDLADEPLLQSTMHIDRADQFKRRLKWDVTLSDGGWECDAYDHDDTLYVIWVLPDNTHGGSMRFLPLSGRTMVNDHFSTLLKDGPLHDPHIWECTRFCLREGVSSQVAACLMLAGGELMRHFALTHLLGVFDARMVRIYRMIGASPLILGRQGEGREAISVGLWQYSDADRAKVLSRAGISSALSEHWFLRSFGCPIAREIAA